ncbi:MAG TPA: DMT family transporter [Candidatus Poseidoniaceae archaeon]|nr:MAG: DMT family transporter [Euryarchaeota archaeon TMED141]DAC10197.1 MAG TPA: DMT family transporter [Candidatus Poseidoniales archaeon]DAC17818.1 MAG TPA: DMT family transporter [Candidatus Poseidoniales archaeon]HII18520.1 DMT family transporter [Candidatus Poseidoniaceae archaeon]HII96673.1 DMT family transporter [Candidatus Poseidoniaceae archaeon]
MNHAGLHVRLWLVAAFWGVAWTAGRVIATEMDDWPVLGAWLRYLIAVPAFLLWLRFSEGWFVPSMPQWRRLFWIGACSTFLYQVLFMYGMGWTAAGDASLMITLNPLFTSILAVIVLGHPMTKQLGGGLALGLLGIGVLFLASPNVDLPTSERWLGNAFIAASALAWATATLLMRRAMDVEEAERDGPMSPLQITVWSSAVGLAFLTPWSAYEVNTGGWPTIEWSSLLSIVFLALLSTVLAYVWFAEGVKRIGPSRTSTYVYLVPIFGILSGYLLLGEQLGWSLVIALVLILSGVSLAQRSTKA